MRNLIRGIAMGIVASLAVMLIRQQQAKAEQAAYFKGVRQQLAEIERDTFEKGKESRQVAADIDRLFEENKQAMQRIDQTVSRVRTVVNGRSRAN